MLSEVFVYKSQKVFLAFSVWLIGWLVFKKCLCARAEQGTLKAGFVLCLTWRGHSLQNWGFTCWAREPFPFPFNQRMVLRCARTCPVLNIQHLLGVARGQEQEIIQNSVKTWGKVLFGWNFFMKKNGNSFLLKKSSILINVEGKIAAQYWSTFRSQTMPSGQFLYRKV